ncbi:MAG TPA: tetratricopeptide repeat protein [Chlamydiales bacterium]|nr:tetratricopeptide repeat protein [Chlamydiales bacterium]
MSSIAWLEILNWNETQLTDLKNVGYQYVLQGKYDIALKIYKALVTLNPNDNYNNKILGSIYLELNNPLEALNFYNQALKLDPDDAYTEMNRAKSLYLLGYHKQATQAMQKLSMSSNKKVAQEATSFLFIL